MLMVIRRCRRSLTTPRSARHPGRSAPADSVPTAAADLHPFGAHCPQGARLQEGRQR
jgi:hypothetical protein